MTFADHVLDFYRGLKAPKVPEGIETLFPFSNKNTWSLIEAFVQKYYSDEKPRTLLMGINPGRFGAGTTGIGFTDPIRLKEVCLIDNDLEPKAELSSKFIYDVISQFGGPDTFYANFFISSVCPIGFTKEGKNYNYYDDKDLATSVRPFIIDCLKKKLKFSSSKIAFSIGQGSNIKYLNDLNKEFGFFEKTIALPHPRWVMQYRLKRKDEFVNQYVEALKKELS